MKEKTADEMLEELGFVLKQYDDEHIVYEDFDSGVEIVFNLTKMLYYLRYQVGINAETHEAITKKMEELGWL